MTRSLRGQLRVPALLAVSAVAAACGDSEKTTMTTPTGTTEVMTTMASTGPATTTAPTTGADTGGLPECGMYKDQATCMAEPSCVWFEGFVCIVECEQIKDQATCQMQEYCEWFNDQCSVLLA